MNRKIVGATIVLSLVAASTAFAHSTAKGVVKERMNAMETLGDSMKVIGGLLRGEGKFHIEEVVAPARAIMSHSGAAMTNLFPEGSLQAPSEASAKIWEDWTGFEQRASELNKAAEKLLSVAENGTEDRVRNMKRVAEAFGAVADTCKSCHEGYRIKKD